MAFTATVRATIPGTGSRARVHGTYANTAGSTGGIIKTGLTACSDLILQPTGSAIIASSPVVNATFPVVGGSVTIVTSANENGIWQAFGV